MMNALSGDLGVARVHHIGYGPEVQRVEVRPWTMSAGASMIEVVVYFPEEARTPWNNDGPFRFDVTVKGVDAEGRQVQLTDGDDHLAAGSAVDAAYNLRSEVPASSRWHRLSDVVVQVTVGDPY